jgi:DNA-binding XRE family transcriptional regulator
MCVMSPARKAPAGPWAKKLLALRAKWGDGGKPLSQTEAAKRIGVSLRTWAGWELNTVPPKPIQLLIGYLLKD